MLQNWRKFPNRNIQTNGFVYHDTKWPKPWSSMEDPVVPLERNLYGHPLAGLLWESQFEKILLQHGWRKLSNWECLCLHREQGLFLSVHVDDIKLAGKKQTLIRCGKCSTKKSIWENQHLSLIMFFLDALKDNEKNKDIVDSYRAMFKSRISAGAIEKTFIPSKS